MPTYKKNPVSNYYNITNPFENREKLQQNLMNCERLPDPQPMGPYQGIVLGVLGREIDGID
jgi:hypothetical protein